ncbi:22046_t:CDS:2, partial [Dentiscutata erythropus]
NPEEPNKENKKIEEINNSDFISFLEEIKLDYQGADQPLQSALDKFKDYYNIENLLSLIITKVYILSVKVLYLANFYIQRSLQSIK